MPLGPGHQAGLLSPGHRGCPEGLTRPHTGPDEGSACAWDPSQACRSQLLLPGDHRLGSVSSGCTCTLRLASLWSPHALPAVGRHSVQLDSDRFPGPGFSLDFLISLSVVYQIVVSCFSVSLRMVQPPHIPIPSSPLPPLPRSSLLLRTLPSFCPFSSSSCPCLSLCLSLSSSPRPLHLNPGGRTYL